ncbi:MAG: hypothetical protein RJQ01_00820 [Microcella sp.]|uniref:hypothetical protein n=1 Tax=Microcella sp. TaxID=1913979 RepID=UPI003314F1BB
MGLDEALAAELAARAKRREEDQAEREAIVEACKRFAELARELEVPQEHTGWWVVSPFGAIREDGTWFDYLSFTKARLGVHDPAGPRPKPAEGATELPDKNVREQTVPGGIEFLEGILAKTLADARESDADT